MSIPVNPPHVVPILSAASRTVWPPAPVCRSMWAFLRAAGLSVRSPRSVILTMPAFVTSVLILAPVPAAVLPIVGWLTTLHSALVNRVTQVIPSPGVTPFLVSYQKLIKWLRALFLSSPFPV